MANRKEQLTALLRLIDSLLKDPTAREDFSEPLSRRFSSQSNVGTDHQQIEAIYEYCIERLANEEAASFYNNFCIPSIAPQLIKDYVKMEHWRRRGNLEEFCLALYQQYECIINRLGSDSKLNDILPRLLPYHTYTDGRNYDRTPKNSLYPLCKLLYYPTKMVENSQRPLSNLPAIDKYSAILYLIGYGAKMTNVDYEAFITTRNLFTDLYRIRCKNHRGGIDNQYEQETLNRVTARPTHYQIMMLGRFAEFVDAVNDHYAEIPALYNYAMSLPEQKLPSIPGVKVVGKIDLSKVK